MQSLLIRSLTKMSDNVIEGTYGSTYFCINGIKVRVSDHMSTNSDSDLAIIPALKGYVVFPLRFAEFKKIYTFPNIPTVLNYIKQYAHFYKVFVPATKRTAAANALIDPQAVNDLKKFSEVKGWLTTATCPENVTLLFQIFNKFKNEQEKNQFRGLLKTFAGLNAQQKNVWLKDYISKM